eukprot:325644_1
MSKGGWGSCAFGSVISSRSCNKFEIHFKRAGTYKAGHFFMGYISSTIKQSIKNWNHYIGHGQNKEHAVGIHVCPSYDYFSLYDKENSGKKLNY